MQIPNVQIQYSENANAITVTTFRNRKPVTKVVTDKRTGLTVTEVFKENVKKPIERYVYNKI